MTELIIIRGPSGTGKSTIARHLGGIPKVNWFEADMFFERNGHYEFDGTKLGAAHRWCQDNVRANLEDGTETIVSNTTISVSEINDYIGIAEEVGATIRIIRTPRPWNLDQIRDRNTHNVPAKVLKRQMKRYAAHDDECEWDDLTAFGTK